MSKPNFKSKREIEKEVYTVGLAFVKIPSSSTTEGHRQYMSAKRQLEKNVDNPAFRRDFIQNYNGFADFLKRYNMNVPDFNEFLNTDTRKFVKRIEKK
jgi:hypothetical protein